MNQMRTENFIPRIFEGIYTIYGMDDAGVSGNTFEVVAIEKGKMYFEKNPKYIEGHKSGVVIDDNSCWYYYNTDTFNKYFKDIPSFKIALDKSLENISNNDLRVKHIKINPIIPDILDINGYIYNNLWKNNYPIVYDSCVPIGTFFIKTIDNTHNE